MARARLNARFHADFDGTGYMHRRFVSELVFVGADRKVRIANAEKAIACHFQGSYLLGYVDSERRFNEPFAV